MARKFTAVAAAAMVAAVLGVAPSQATVIDKGHYFSEPYSFSHDDCGFDVDVKGTSSVIFRVRAGKGSTATAFYGHDNYSFVETQTNPDTGAFVTITANAVFNEIKARRVEGNIFEFAAVEAGQFRLYDSDGLVARDRGSVHHHILFDTEGDDVPGGIFVEDLGADVHGPHPGFDDFCGLITPLRPLTIPAPGPRAVARPGTGVPIRVAGHGAVIVMARWPAARRSASSFAGYLRADDGDLGTRLQRPVRRLDALRFGGGPREVALEPGRRADEQIASLRVAVVGERVDDVARSERKLAHAPGEPLVPDLEDQLAFEHVERLVEVVHVQGRAGATRNDDVLHHRDMTCGLLAAQ